MGPVTKQAPGRGRTAPAARRRPPGDSNLGCQGTSRCQAGSPDSAGLVSEPELERSSSGLGEDHRGAASQASGSMNHGPGRKRLTTRGYTAWIRRCEVEGGARRTCFQEIRLGTGKTNKRRLCGEWQEFRLEMDISWVGDVRGDTEGEVKSDVSHQNDTPQ